MKKRAFAFAFLILAACKTDGGAQVRASEAGSVSQTVDGTDITVTYSRPRARGRSLFGDLVDYGQVWTPGANWATTLEVSKPVKLNGTELAEGKYSMWMIPNEEEWTVFLDRESRRFHTQRPNSSDAVLSLTVRPDSVAHTEVLTFSFPSVRRDGTTLEMRWGSTRVALDIAVQPTGRGQPAGSGEAYVGTYRLRFAGSGDARRDLMVNVYEEDDVLYMSFSRPLSPDLDSVTVLQSAGTHRFHPVWQRHGEVYDVDREATIVFAVENGAATDFELRGLEDRLIARGTREQ